ncbi:MAG: FmdB family zinc ribbon protein [Dehalococcoidia bacterium]
MPLYPFRCEHCGLEFEVSRPMSQASNPASCPIDGTPGVRIFTAPTTLTTRGQDAPPAPPQPPKPANNWAHFGHSHGVGVGGHSHGAPPPRPAPE